MNHGIKGESIADHMYRMALMSLIAGDIPGLNRERFDLLWCLVLFVIFLITVIASFRPYSFFLSSHLNRCIKIAIVHDIAEGTLSHCFNLLSLSM